MDILLNWIGTIPNSIVQGLIWGIMAIGVYITYKVLDVADLTVDGSIATGAAVFAVLLSSGVNIWICMICSFISGMLAGLVTGFLHTFVGIPAILAGILTQLMLYSANLTIMGKSIISIPRLKFGDQLIINLASDKIWITILVVGAITAGIIFALYLFFGTEFGSALRATGNNIKMSRAQGINTDFAKVFGLALSNGVVALAGSLLAQYNGSADVKMGTGAIVVGLAAVVIGGALSVKLPSNFALRLSFVVVGAIIYWMVFQLVMSFNIDADFLKMLSAVVVAVFLGVPHIKGKYFSKKKKGGVSKNA
ncbi:MAG: ABC transporter permease [Clostridia bacterium]|nr:ABC transporter permease [Clostridia bacterium]